ncbi:MAG: hypothetical protein V2J89_15355 [Halieaceae bacterium]|jgi:hypothetical protein|nr:hypothetical protein [Halieaceae bacterium]
MSTNSLLKTACAIALFGAGALLGTAAQLHADIPTAGLPDSLDGSWQSLAQNPDFRAAVIAVIDSCLVDNGVIYCE